MSTQNRPDVLDSLFLVTLREVGIPESHDQGLVAEELLHGRQIHAVHHQMAGEGVAQVVETEVDIPASLHAALKACRKSV